MQDKMDNKQITLSLPYAPSVNRIWRRGAHTTYKDKKAVAFEKAVLAERVRHDKTGDVLFPAGVGVIVFVTMHPRMTKEVEQHPETYDPLTVSRVDADAQVKTLFDSMQNAGIYENDKQILRFSVQVGQPVKGGGLTVCVTEK